jgi:hypothetical protein
MLVILPFTAPNVRKRLAGEIAYTLFRCDSSLFASTGTSMSFPGIGGCGTPSRALRRVEGENSSSKGVPALA